jgi:hypothetical protein
LRKIANNLNKKHTTLRKEVVKTCEVFENEHLPVFPYEVIFGLLRQLPEANSLSASLLFFPFIQNVVNLGFNNEKMNREIVTFLGHVKSLPRFRGLEHETKMQQMLVLLVSRNSITLNQLPSTLAILNILMALSNTAHKSIWSKSLTIATHLSILHLQELDLDGSNM